MSEGRQTTPWRADEASGSYYRLVDGALFYAPMLVDLDIAMEAVGEVDWDRIDSEDAIRNRRIEQELFNS